MNSKVVIPALIGILILSSGCGKDKSTNNPPESNIPQELLGTWTYQSATINGVPISLALILGWEQGTVSARFTVSQDGSFVYEELDANGDVIWTEYGTFEVNGNTATISITSDTDGPIDPPPDPMTGTWQVEGNTLTLTTDYNGATVVLTATR